MGLKYGFNRNTNYSCNYFNQTNGYINNECNDTPLECKLETCSDIETTYAEVDNFKELHSEEDMKRSEIIKEQRKGNNVMVNNTTIKVNDGKNIINIMQDIITELANGMHFHHHTSLCSHKIGLQGFKRMHEYYSHMDEYYLNEIQSYCIDIFGEKIIPVWNQIHDNYEIENTADMLNAWYEHELIKYEKLNFSVTELSELGYAYESDLVIKIIKGNTRELTKCRRYIQEFTNADWQWNYIGIKDGHLHKKYKEKENEKYCLHSK